MRKVRLLLFIGAAFALFAFSLKHEKEGREFDREIPVIAMAVDLISNGVECGTCHTGKMESEEVAEIKLTGQNILVAGQIYEFEIHFSPDLEASEVEMQLLAYDPNSESSVGGFNFIHETKTIEGYTPGGQTIDFGLASMELGTGKIDPVQTLQWTAPLEINGPITINIAGLAHDNDGSTMGDESFAKQLTLVPEQMAPEFTVYPREISRDFVVETVASNSAISTIQLFDITGEVVADFGEYYTNRGENSWNLTVRDGLSPGMYLLAVIENGRAQTRQVYLR